MSISDVKTDDKTQEWTQAHIQEPDFYILPHVDRAFLTGYMRSPIITSILALCDQAHKPMQILEIGCGSGIDSVCLALCGCDVTVLDVSEHLLKAAQDLSKQAMRTFEQQSLSIRFLQGDIFDLEQYIDTYDVVLCFGVTIIWHEYAKRIEALRNIRAVIKDAGYMLLGNTNTLNPLFKLIPMNDLATDTAQYSMSILEKEATDANFVIIKRGAVGLSPSFEQWLTNPLFKAPLRLANKLLTYLPFFLQFRLAPRIFVVAQKS